MSAELGAIAGQVVRDAVVPPGEGWAEVIRQGQILRIVDQAGKQGVDFLCYHARDTEERYHAANTMKKARTIWLTTGHVLYSDLARPMFTIVADTCGRHDTIGGCCSAPSNFLMYGVKDVPGCRETFLRVLGRYGLGRRDIVANLNFFSNVPVSPDGRLADTVFIDGLSRAGDFRRPARRDGCPRLHLELPASEQPLHGPESDADPSDDLGAGCPANAIRLKYLEV